MKGTKKLLIWLPLVAALFFAGGWWTGRVVMQRGTMWTSANGKLGSVLGLIRNYYVDDIDMDSLTEVLLPDLMAKLDPHSMYIPASELQDVNSELEGSFGGVGISFSIMDDSITVVEIISGGPAEKVGMMAGDRIVTVNDSVVAGTGVTNQGVLNMLRGARDTRVELGVKRTNSPKLLKFSITRGDIPVNSIDAAYMLDDSIGYVKVNKFSRNTDAEFLTAMARLRSQNATSFIIDLRGNVGGYFEKAIVMANEFLPSGKPIVVTKGRNGIVEQEIYSDGTGGFQDQPVVVLLDEYSASSSEIFAGALQDNDRALIVGRRSFGKGLVQRQIELPDSSALRLTVSRYYTPSGRCIQKSYTHGDNDSYSNELMERYYRGEAFHADSIMFNTRLKFTTSTGRTVYGGGGIMPDIFVPTDTTDITSYYINVVNGGILHKYAFQYTDQNRSRLEGCKTVEDLLDRLPADDRLLYQFVTYASQNGIPARWYYINMSRMLIVNRVKALIARDVVGMGGYYDIANRIDTTVGTAVQAIQQGKANHPIRK
jgi:carboxyl-terminal processing protease